ncbi:hypothetical protein [Candidatus Ichthyocystis sparus]|uniref:hypothetical protein n=1 Tax=Candidatus Ichthyocystis sparus TaxID=1561004 RepID=UPI000B83505B|nr:hypothetical protein [Candidatus Ichthyocystis sparus]
MSINNVLINTLGSHVVNIEEEEEESSSESSVISLSHMDIDNLSVFSNSENFPLNDSTSEIDKNLVTQSTSATEKNKKKSKKHSLTTSRNSRLFQGGKILVLLGIIQIFIVIICVLFAQLKFGTSDTASPTALMNSTESYSIGTTPEYIFSSTTQDYNSGSSTSARIRKKQKTAKTRSKKNKTSTHSNKIRNKTTDVTTSAKPKNTTSVLVTTNAVNNDQPKVSTSVSVTTANTNNEQSESSTSATSITPVNPQPTMVENTSVNANTENKHENYVESTTTNIGHTDIDYDTANILQTLIQKNHELNNICLTTTQRAAITEEINDFLSENISKITDADRLALQKQLVQNQEKAKSVKDEETSAPCPTNTVDILEEMDKMEVLIRRNPAPEVVNAAVGNVRSIIARGRERLLKKLLKNIGKMS